MTEKAERLDRLLSRLGYGSRSDVQFWVKRGMLGINGVVAKSPALKVKASEVTLDGQPMDYPDGLTLIYHKPLGAVCSHRETGRLIYEDFPERWGNRKPPLSSVGRLDMDTSGLLILTDDGQLNHRITSPKQHISRSYTVTLDAPLTGNEADIFASGKLMLKEDDKPCLPAELIVIDEQHASLVLHEGRYHQARRMFAAVGNHVTALTRSHIGNLSLEETGLQPGEYRAVTPDEVMRMLLGDQ